MSKYNPLWAFVKKNGPALGREAGSFKLTYNEIEKILGFPIDHSFLTFKKELLEFDYKVGKISMKEKTIQFIPV